MVLPRGSDEFPQLQWRRLEDVRAEVAKEAEQRNQPTARDSFDSDSVTAPGDMPQMSDALPRVEQAGDSGVKSAVDDIITDGSHYVDGKLKPNTTYKTGEHDYIYKTNVDGLITNAQADRLKLKTHDGRLNHNSNTPGKLDGDHAGHLFGDRFGGSPELDNLVSQAQKVNLSEYKVIENQWAKALENGQEVTNINIDINYSKGSSRPSSFYVSYEIYGIPYFQEITQ